MIGMCWSVRAEVVVRRGEYDCTIYLKQRLPILVGLFYVPLFHPSDPLLSGRKRCRENGIKHQAGAAAFTGSIGSRGPSGDFTRKLKRECRRLLDRPT